MDRRTGSLFALALAALLTACGREPETHGTDPARRVPASPEITSVGVPVPIVDRKAPTLVAETAAGETLDLDNQRGKVVVVNFWATWCAPCIVETPLLVETYRDYRDSGVVVVGVSLDREGFDVVRPFLERFRVDYPVVLGDSRISEAFGGTYILPTTFFISRAGAVVSRINGRLHEDVLRAELERLTVVKSPT